MMYQSRKPGNARWQGEMQKYQRRSSQNGNTWTPMPFELTKTELRRRKEDVLHHRFTTAIWRQVETAL